MAYTNSPLVDYTLLSPNHSGTRTHSIDTITIHMIVGQLSVETLGYIFAPISRQASSNYGVGYDGRIGMYVEEKNRSWCSSSSYNDQRSITIETASDLTWPYAVNDKAYNALIELCADICKRNGKSKMVWYGTYNATAAVWGSDPEVMYMTLHKWFSATACPGYYLETHMQDIADKVNAILNPIPEPEPIPEPIPDFTDVPSSSNIYKPVMWAASYGIAKGYDDGTFKPDNECTRLQFAIMIWRMMEKPTATSTVNFTDVTTGTSGYKAIQWAVEAGIIKGFKDGTFRPNDPITREQAAVMIWRWGNKTEPNVNSKPFIDIDTKASSYKAILWGAENGIIKGYSDNTFRPAEKCLRKHAVIFLYRIAQLFW